MIVPRKRQEDQRRLSGTGMEVERAEDVKVEAEQSNATAGRAVEE